MNIYVSQRHDGVVSVLRDVPTFSGIDLTFYGTPQQLNALELVDRLSARMSQRVTFPPCLYVGQELELDANIILRVDALRSADGGQLLPFAAIPLHDVDISDITIQAEELSSIDVRYAQGVCHVCGEVSAWKCEGCHTAQYCSDMCHDYDWNMGTHKKICQSMGL